MFMCDCENEIFTKDIEDLKDFKELGMELQEIKKSACYGYHLFVVFKYTYITSSVSSLVPTNKRYP